MAIKSIGVVGAGQMGNGIAQVASLVGYLTVMMDISEDSLKKGLKTIEGSCDRLIKKGSMSEDSKMSLLSRILTTSKMEDLKSCDLVIEAASENIDIKIKIFKSLDMIVKSSAVLASNTSSISITKLAGVTSRPDKVCGMHFMNPVPLMKLVEGIRGLQTSNETFDMVKVVSEKMGKTFIPADKDMPGFIVNRILMPMLNEAIYTLNEGIGTPAAIDEAMKLGTNQPMGPLTLADFIGLDTCLSIMQVLHEGLGDSKYSPCPLLVKYVEAGWLGRKSGRGFYQYT